MNFAECLCREGGAARVGGRTAEDAQACGGSTLTRRRDTAHHSCIPDEGERGLLIKTLFQTGARVSEFVNLKAEDVFFEEQMILIARAKGGKSRYVPILPELAQELRTHLGQRTVGYLFETNRATQYSPRRIQQIIKETAEQAQITKRVYPHLLRHSVATTLLERGMPIEQIQKFLGHSKLETTQLYAESSTAMMRESYQRALSR